jgi:4-hydroxyproline epimerase
MKIIRVIDSHTGGEPTRVVAEGGPDLGAGPLAARRTRFGREFDSFRRAVIDEPRGSSALVGALLCEPADRSCSAGVIFFNNVGYLGMCGHGTIGLLVTLAHLRRVAPGVHAIETPVGVVKTELYGPADVAFDNVPSYRLRKDVTIDVEGHGPLTGDIAWGGNWFFLAEEHGQDLSLANVDRLVDFTWRIRQALQRGGITGRDGAEIDHVELFGPPQNAEADSRNFVLCPGKAYDRSPCGTGTSAKLACLYEDGKLRPGDVWVQESIVGSLFEGKVSVVGERVIPNIRGTAFITAETNLILDPRDPLALGIGP